MPKDSRGANTHYDYTTPMQKLLTTSQLPRDNKAFKGSSSTHLKVSVCKAHTKKRIMPDTLCILNGTGSTHLNETVRQALAHKHITPRLLLLGSPCCSSSSHTLLHNSCGVALGLQRGCVLHHALRGVLTPACVRGGESNKMLVWKHVNRSRRKGDHSHALSSMCLTDQLGWFHTWIR